MQVVLTDWSCLCSVPFLQTGAVKQDFYKDCDLRIGGEVNVWGRRVVIADCDEFTKQYYRFKYGIGEAPAAPETEMLNYYKS